MNDSYYCDGMPPRFEIIGLLEEKKEDDRAEAAKFVAQRPYRGLFVCSLPPREPSFESVITAVRDQLHSVGASLDENNKDKIGDGDQSPIVDAKVQHVYEEIFRTGAYPI
jgi:hypothetical protein